MALRKFIPLPPQAYLKTLFFYDDDGNFCWAVPRPNNRTKAGDVAGCPNSKGYWRVEIDGVQYQLHRIIWVYHHGIDPEILRVDHADKNKSNNNIENLRLATPSQNNCNKKMLINNTTGFPGVRKRILPSGRVRYASEIQGNGKKIQLGHFDTAEESYAKYLAAAEFYHGDFAAYKSPVPSPTSSP